MNGTVYHGPATKEMYYDLPTELDLMRYHRGMTFAHASELIWQWASDAVIKHYQH
jgi:hypothetical protein